MAKLKQGEKRVTIRPYRGEAIIRDPVPWPEDLRLAVMWLVAVVDHLKGSPSPGLLITYRLVNNPASEWELRMSRRILKEWLIREVRRLAGKPEKRFWPHWRTIFKEQDGKAKA
jgi:hypothetical protein